MTDLAVPDQRTDRQARPAPVCRTLGIVSFLNALPLYASLQGSAAYRIVADVPSALVGRVRRGEFDLALLPVVDGFRERLRLGLVSDACIASDGETLTVRVYSRIPPEKIERLEADPDSATSVILARLVWQELYGRRLEVVPIGDKSDAGGKADRSVLLIGDKVVRRRPRGFGFEVDLGAAWKHLTGLPFVFAAWYGPRGGDFEATAKALAAARDAGTAGAAELARRHAGEHGWPESIAVQYLTQIMQYRLTPAMRQAMDRFFSLAVERGLLT